MPWLLTWLLQRGWLVPRLARPPPGPPWVAAAPPTTPAHLAAAGHHGRRPACSEGDSRGPSRLVDQTYTALLIGALWLQEPRYRRSRRKLLSEGQYGLAEQLLPACPVLPLRLLLRRCQPGTQFRPAFPQQASHLLSRRRVREAAELMT